MRTLDSLKRARLFLHKMDVRPISLVVPAFFYFLAALCEGASMALLFPLAQGVVKMDFSFVKEIVVFKFLFQSIGFFAYFTNTGIFVMILVLIFLTSLLKNVFQYAGSLMVTSQVRKFAHFMRVELFSRYVSFGKMFFDRNSLGHLHTIVLDFTNQLAVRVLELHGFINNSFLFFIYMVLMSFISWKITLILMAVSPVFYFSSQWLIERIKVSSKNNSFAQRDLSKKLHNILSCMPIVMAYNREKKEQRHFEQMSNDVARLEYSIDKKYYLITPLQEIVTLIVILFAFSLVAFMVVKVKKDLANFVIYFYVLKRAAGAFNGMINFRGAFATVRGQLQGVRQIFDDKDKFFVLGGKEEFLGLQSGIEFRNLQFSYSPEIPVIQDVSFFIAKGKVTAFVGPTGSGKSTLISLILRFYDIGQNQLFIDGVDVRRFSVASLRKHLALVSQDTILFNDTIRNNIIYGVDRDISEDEINCVLKKARLYDFVMGLPNALETIVGDRGIRLSGGEKQRATIARALLKESDILLLDEATSSLDSSTEKLIQEAIQEAFVNRTSIVVAHRLSTIKNADRIIVIEKGRVVEQGTLPELLERKGAFYGYWEAQKFF